MDAADTEELLQVEVRRLKTLSGTRRSVPAELNVGDLGGARLVVPLDALGPIDDVSLASDVLERSFARLGEEDYAVWVTRTGELEPSDADRRWRSATSDVRRTRGRPVGSFHVVTRHGWFELPSGTGRAWSRMRATWTPPYDDERTSAGPDPIEGWPIRF